MLHGVTSHGSVPDKCGIEGSPGSVFANVFKMKDFIEDVLVRSLNLNESTNK